MWLMIHKRVKGIYIHHKKVPTLNFILLMIFLGVSAFITIKYGPSVTRLLNEPGRFRDWIHSFGYNGILVFIFIQILQIVIAAIPGEVVQIAGGFIYGTWLGTLYLMIGVIFGSVVVFYASRLLGYPLVQAVVTEEKLTRLKFLIENPKADIALFILFLLPGLPKDILSYIAGLTPIKPLKFLVIATLARFPALFVSAYIGTNLQTENYLMVIVFSSLAVILFFVGFYFKDQLIDRIHKRLSFHKSKKN